MPKSYRTLHLKENRILQKQTVLNNLSCLDGLRILVVDENPDSLEFINIILEDYSAQVTAVQTEGEALEALAQLQPDMLLSNIAVLNEEDYSLIRQVRLLEVEQETYLPAIALIAFSREEECNAALEGGFQMCIKKPFEINELVWAIAMLATASKRVQAYSRRSPAIA